MNVTVKKMTKDLIKYGLKNSKNKKEAIQGALAAISYLTNHEAEESVSAKDLKKLSGGDESLITNSLKQKISEDYDVYCT